MRASDVFRMAVHNLWQRRMRTLFNLTGIVTGCIVLMMTAAGTSGARNAIHALFDSSDFTRQIYIFPGGRSWEEPPEGEIVIDAEISDARRERIHRALANQWNERRQNQDASNEITTKDLEAIRKLPHVLAVVPEAPASCVIKTDADSLESGTAAINVHSAILKDSLLVGTLPNVDDRDGVLVHEFQAWQMGFKNDADLPKLIGQPLTIEYRVTENRVANIYNLLTKKWNVLDIDEIQKQTQFLQTLFQLIGDLDKTSLSEEQKTQLRELIGSGLKTNEDVPEIIMTRQFIVRGIAYAGDENPVAALFRQWFHSPRGRLQIHPDVAQEIYASNQDMNSYYSATVIVESSAHLRSVTNALNDLQYSPQSSLAVLENIDYQIDQSGWIIYGIAAAILLTSAIGISNTLFMSIVERTPEFGIMKSIGARDSHILWLMIIEGAILGIVGAATAILLSLLLGIAGQSLLKMYVESRTQTELAGSLFQFQILPAVAILVISVTLCVIASLLPAWRAARLDPVVAMRRT
jgi:ABC-type antimicrobial peptide transport system permease subunit